MSDLADRIREAIARSGKTQRVIASEIGITEVALSRYVNGIRVPRATLMPALAKCLDVPVEWLSTGIMPFDTHTEMIIDYTTDGTDYQYSDNHGVLTRCKKCMFWQGENNCCHPDNMGLAFARENDYCSYGKRKK